MRCICWFLVVILVLLICLPLVVFIGICAPRCFHPKKIDHQSRLVFNSTRLPSNTSILTSTAPVTEKEDDKSDLYINGSFTGGEEPVPDNDDDRDNKFRTKNDLVSESKLKIARLETDKPIKAVKEPKILDEKKEVKGLMKGEDTERPNENDEEWKRASFEDTEKPRKAVREPVMEDDVKEESSEHYLIEESKSSNSTENHQESNHQDSSQKRGSQQNDEPGKMEDHEKSRRSEKQKEKVLKTNRVSQSEEYDEVEEEQLIVKTKNPPKKTSHD